MTSLNARDEPKPKTAGLVELLEGIYKEVKAETRAKVCALAKPLNDIVNLRPDPATAYQGKAATLLTGGERSSTKVRCTIAVPTGEQAKALEGMLRSGSRTAMSLEQRKAQARSNNPNSRGQPRRGAKDV